MQLEARAANCFSSEFVLKIDGRPFGKFQRRWLSESMDIYLTEQRYLEFQKLGVMGSEFELRGQFHQKPIGSCQRSGLFSNSWDMVLSSGVGRLERAGWLDTAYEFKRDDQVLARADRLGWFERGWVVD